MAKAGDEKVFPTTADAFEAYRKNFKDVQLNPKTDLFTCMVAHTPENGEAHRIIAPHCNDFDKDIVTAPRPDGTMDFILKTTDEPGNVHIQQMYQHLALAARGVSNATLDEVFGGACMIAYSGIYSDISNCVFLPPLKPEEEKDDPKQPGDFCHTAAKLGGLIYFTNAAGIRDLPPPPTETNDPEKPVQVQLSEPKSYRLCPCTITFKHNDQSLKKCSMFFQDSKGRLGMDVLSVSETDEYHNGTSPMEKKEPSKKKEDYWKYPKTVLHRSLQQLIKLELSGTDYIKYEYKIDKENSEIISRAALFNIAKAQKVKNEDPIGVFDTMKSFMSTVLVEIASKLGEGDYCFVQFERASSARNHKGTGKFWISYKGKVTGSVFLKEYEYAFGLHL